MYKGIFKAKYDLSGKDWVRRIEPEDLKVFISIGLQACVHGQLGGIAVYTQKGASYMSRIGRIGAIAANSIKAWNRAVREETERELGVVWDY